MLPLNELYNMDCMDGMKQFPDGYFDLAIVDPPYGINRFKNGETSRLRKYGQIDTVNNLKPEASYFSELFRVSKNQIIWGYNHLCDLLPPTSEFVFWYKHQPVETYAGGELAYTSFTKTGKVFDYPYFGTYHADPDGRIHPAQKPIALYKWLLTKYAKDGDKILDTHVGSASSLIACHDLHFDFIGFELDETYYKAAKERMEQHFAQLTLF